MKTNIYTSNKAIFALNLFLLLFISNLFAQNPTWQWAKKGGTTDNLGNNSEQIKAMRTDANGNVYILAPVGIYNLMIDGNPKPTYGLYAGDGSATLDYVIASFSCDGTYRWSKVIGGQETDQVQNIQLDANGNVYAVGEVKNNSDNLSFPGLYPQVHFDTDVVLPYGVDNIENFQSLFLIKYNSDGVFQWLKMPQAADVGNPNTIFSHSLDLQLDSFGNIYWACFLKPGSYANGVFLNNADGYYILKYNSAGEYLQNFNLNIDIISPTPIYLNFKMLLNENTNKVYLTRFLKKSPNISSNWLINIGNESIDFTRFIACFDLNGNYLWNIQNNSLQYTSPNAYDIVDDNENNIYYMGSASTIGNSNEPNPVIESFNGVQFPIPTDYNKLPLPFITKLDQNGNTIWQSSGQIVGQLNAQMFPYGLGVNNVKNEIATVGSQRGFQWGNFSIQQAATHGYDPYIVRLNKATGVAVGMETFTSDNNTDDAATAITADNLGNYFVGGMFWSQVNIGGTVLQNTGAQTDFFIAKVGTSNCALDVEKTLFKDLKIYPNPVKGLLHIDNQEVIKYQLFNSLGMQIQSKALSIGGTIDCSNLSAGFYILNLESQSGEKKVVKVLKE